MKYNLHIKKDWIEILALQAETAITEQQRRKHLSPEDYTYNKTLTESAVTSPSE
jgi:hypothetical protein